MANTKYQDLLPFVLPELPGCSAPLAEQHIRAAVIDLCRRSKVWVVDADPMATSIGNATYDIDTDTGTALVGIRSMHLDGLELEAVTSIGRHETGQPKVYMQRTPESFVLHPTPTAVGTLSMTLAVAPSRTSSAFPGWIAENYHEAICAGAKSRLMLMPGNVWHNERQGFHYRSIFEQEVAVAQGDAMTSFVRAATRTTSHH